MGFSLRKSCLGTHLSREKSGLRNTRFKNISLRGKLWSAILWVIKGSPPPPVSEKSKPFSSYSQAVTVPLSAGVSVGVPVSTVTVQ